MVRGILLDRGELPVTPGRYDQQVCTLADDVESRHQGTLS